MDNQDRLSSPSEVTPCMHNREPCDSERMGSGDSSDSEEESSEESSKDQKQTREEPRVPRKEGSPRPLGGRGHPPKRAEARSPIIKKHHYKMIISRNIEKDHSFLVADDCFSLGSMGLPLHNDNLCEACILNGSLCVVGTCNLATPYNTLLLLDLKDTSNRAVFHCTEPILFVKPIAPRRVLVILGSQVSILTVEDRQLQRSHLSIQLYRHDSILRDVSIHSITPSQFFCFSVSVDNIIKIYHIIIENNTIYRNLIDCCRERSTVSSISYYPFLENCISYTTESGLLSIYNYITKTVAFQLNTAEHDLYSHLYLSPTMVLCGYSRGRLLLFDTILNSCVLKYNNSYSYANGTIQLLPERQRVYHPFSLAQSHSLTSRSILVSGSIQFGIYNVDLRKESYAIQPQYHGHLFTSRVGSENVDLTYRLNASAFLDTRNRSSLVVTDSLGNIAIYHPPL